MEQLYKLQYTRIICLVSITEKLIGTPVNLHVYMIYDKGER